MSTMLERMRAAQKARSNFITQDPAIFPFWKLPYGGSAIQRLLPFTDPVSEGFWVEKKMLPMYFVDPTDDSKQLTYKVPCKEMYVGFSKPKQCKVANVIRALYNDADALKNAGRIADAERITKLASRHWIALTAYYQGFIVKAGMVEETTPENPIRVSPFSKKLHKLIETTTFSETDPFEMLPTGEFTVDDIKLITSGDVSEQDYQRIHAKLFGHNLTIHKGQTGAGEKVYADYSSSKYARVATDLTDEQIAAIAHFGLHDLRQKLPTQPTDEQYDIMVEMMHVSLAGGEWNPAWEEAGLKPYRPRAENEEGAAADEPETTTGRTARKVEAEPEADATPAAPATSSAVLEKLKSRTAAKAAEEPAPVDVTEAPDRGATPSAVATSEKTSVLALADRIRQKTKAKAAAETAAS